MLLLMGFIIIVLLSSIANKETDAQRLYERTNVLDAPPPKPSKVAAVEMFGHLLPRGVDVSVWMPGTYFKEGTWETRQLHCVRRRKALVKRYVNDTGKWVKLERIRETPYFETLLPLYTERVSVGRKA